MKLLFFILGYVIIKLMYITQLWVLSYISFIRCMYNYRKLSYRFWCSLNKSRDSAWVTLSSSWFQSLITFGKKENLYVSVLVDSCKNQFWNPLVTFVVLVGISCPCESMSTIPLIILYNFDSLGFPIEGDSTFLTH